MDTEASSISDDIKKKFILPLTIELQDHKEIVFHNAPVSPTCLVTKPGLTVG